MGTYQAKGGRQAGLYYARKRRLLRLKEAEEKSPPVETTEEPEGEKT